MDSEEIGRFFRNIECKLSTFKELDQYLGSRFNVFRYIRREIDLSLVLGDLLDPQGPHGQGDLFSRKFLEMLNVGQTQNLIDARVETEPRTSNSESEDRRIDITLVTNHVAVGIESKPWAVEQPGWVRDYSEHLRRLGSDNFVLVYLTRTARRDETRYPEDRDAQAALGDRFRTICFEEEFREWLEACHQDCKAESVRIFLKQFIQFVRTMEVTAMLSQEEKELVKLYINADPSEWERRLRTAYVTSQAWPEIQRESIGDFLRRLKQSVEQSLGKTVGTEWVIEDNAEKFPDWPFRLFKRDWQHNDCGHDIRLQGKPNPYLIGIFRHPSSATPITALAAQLGNGLRLSTGVLRCFDWCSGVEDEYSGWESPEGLMKLRNPTTLEYFKNRFVHLANLAERTIDKHYGIEHG